VEVGRIVVVEVHRYDDPVEEAEAGHRAIMSAAADGEWADASTSIGGLGGRPSLDGPPDKVQPAPRNKSGPLRNTQQPYGISAVEWLSVGRFSEADRPLVCPYSPKRGCGK
jgi:hypothetical protein